MIEARLIADRVTKGAVRFTQSASDEIVYPLSIYLRHEQVETLGLKSAIGQAVTVTVAP